MADNGKEYVVTLDVPGSTQDGLEVKPGPVAGTVSIRVEGRAAMDGKLLRSERGATGEGKLRYARVLPVGWDADVAKARASISNGVLTLFVPKAENKS